MKTRITIICENSIKSSGQLVAEHGLSFLIEGGDTSLFDTGQGYGLEYNMKALKKDFNSISRIILSHGHYDHTGGLLSALKKCNRKTPVFLHRNALGKKIAFEKEGNVEAKRYIGMPVTQMEYEEAGAEFNFISGFQKITDRISAICEIKRPPGWKAWDTRLMHESNGDVTYDPFLDDLSLLLNTDSGTVILLGCAHAGIIEILNDISSNTGYSEFHAVIGGTHLLNAPEEYINNTFDTLKKYKVRMISPLHCTGFDAQCRFASIFNNEFVSAGVGTVFEF